MQQEGAACLTDLTTAYVNSVPTDRLLIQIDVDLFAFEVLVDSVES